MFVCIECGCLFGEPKRHIERHGLDTPPYEEWYGCPLCNGAYADAHRCECCGGYITDAYIKTGDGKRYCSDCVYDMDLGDED